MNNGSQSGVDPVRGQAKIDITQYEEVKTEVTFGQFVAAVIMADRIDVPLDDILGLLTGDESLSLGQIIKQFDVDVSELRQGFGEIRSELARSMTNPPTRDCFTTTP